MQHANFTRRLRIFSGLLLAFTFFLASCSQGEIYEPKLTAVKTQSKIDSSSKIIEDVELKVVVNDDSLDSLKPPVDWHP